MDNGFMFFNPFLPGYKEKEMLEKEKNYNTFLMSSESIMAVTSTKVGMMDNINQLSSHSAPCHGNW